jgi:hypothetical protein
MCLVGRVALLIARAKLNEERKSELAAVNAQIDKIRKSRRLSNDQRNRQTGTGDRCVTCRG